MRKRSSKIRRWKLRYPNVHYFWHVTQRTALEHALGLELDRAHAAW